MKKKSFEKISFMFEKCSFEVGQLRAYWSMGSEDNSLNSSPLTLVTQIAGVKAGRLRSSGSNLNKHKKNKFLKFHNFDKKT